MKAFERKITPPNPTAMQLSEAELDRESAILRVLICMNDNWGKWEYDAKDDIIKFKGPTLPRQYVQARKELDEKNSEFLRLQQEVKKVTKNKVDAD
jgi:hypothetical protein